MIKGYLYKIHFHKYYERGFPTFIAINLTATVKVNNNKKKEMATLRRRQDLN